MRWLKRSGETGASAPTPQTPPSRTAGMPGETFTRVFITVDSGIVLLLTFAFMFGNGWETAKILGVHYLIAPLIQPAVDLAVVGLMVGLRYLAAHGWTDEELRKPRAWLRIFGAMTLAMNTALPLHQHHFGRAAWDAIGPVLLIAWSELAPWLLRAIYTVRLELEAAKREATPAPAVTVVSQSPLGREEGAPELGMTLPPLGVSQGGPVADLEQQVTRPQSASGRFLEQASTGCADVTPEPSLAESEDVNQHDDGDADEDVEDELTRRRTGTPDTREIVRSYLIDWSKRGRTYADRPGVGLHTAMERDPKAFGMEKPVTRRRINQICQTEWPELYAKGLVKTPMAVGDRIA
ncbi:hypothetical protein ACIOHC_35895 [Streptomyces sp. NPDC088252]|uniref:hypothetical protein n=1 Tax=Streptomyces sp. NPDC088252 TaxID=3365845 RepID=UPI003800AE72